MLTQVPPSSRRRHRLAAALSLALACCAPVAAAAGGWQSPQTARYEPAALAEVARRVDAARASKRTPIVVFDLDHTLYDNRPRTLLILAEFAATLPAAQQDAAAKIRGLALKDVRYRLADTLAAAGIADASLVAAAEAYWAPRFFSDAYAALDVPLPGAADFVRDLWRRGALVVYLTGRDAPRMFSGTSESLKKWGFPIGVRGSQLVLKPTQEEKDEAFKQASLDQVSALGAVVASFENEPGNLAAMAQRWPEALAVFLDTDFNPKGAVTEPPAGARWVGDYSGYVAP